MVFFCFFQDAGMTVFDDGCKCMGAYVRSVTRTGGAGSLFDHFVIYFCRAFDP